MNCKICEWICHRLGCFRLTTTSGEASRESILDAKGERLEQILGRLDTNATRLEHAVTDINIQKHALEQFTKDITR